MGVGQRKAVTEVPNPNRTFQDAGINTSALQIRLRGTLGAAAGACPLTWGLSAPWSVISGCRGLNVDLELQDGKSGCFHQQKSYYTRLKRLFTLTAPVYWWS